MANEIAKLLLEHAETFLDRAQAVEAALSLGMPLHEIETYLDWLDQTRLLRRGEDKPEDKPRSGDGRRQADD